MATKATWLGVLLALSGPFWLSARTTEPVTQMTLAQVVGKRPFPDYAKWWPIGDRFSTFMSEAIVGEWSALPGNDGDLGRVNSYAADYVKTVYQRDARASLIDEFARRGSSRPLQSGEFDALSYAFFRSAFELIETHIKRYDQALAIERRLFARRVGKKFFARLHDSLALDLPAKLDDDASFARFRDSLRKVIGFLKDQRYCRDHAAFRFDVDVLHKGTRIVQPEAAFLDGLKRQRVAYALYEMGYPAILPSAVYLFETIGEAQHHSSRTIEELFDRVGYEARETEDFDPRGYPPDMVVELWQIRGR